MSGHDWAFLIGCGSVALAGLYIMAEPRRLFIRADERSRYRPEAVDYDSPQGVRMRAMAPVLVGLALFFLLVYAIAGGLPE
jgi:hypothetical protein